MYLDFLEVDVKKIILILLIILCFTFSILAYTFPNNGGFGLSFSGTSENSQLFSLTVTQKLSNWNFLTPSVETEAFLTLNDSGFHFGGVKIALSVDLFYVKNSLLPGFALNPTLWVPAIKVGYLLNKSYLFNIEISTFRFMEKDYIYEWFVPFVNIDENGIKNWGVTFIRTMNLCW